jgi:hypothetical protein
MQGPQAMSRPARGLCRDGTGVEDDQIGAGGVIDDSMPTTDKPAGKSFDLRRVQAAPKGF